MRKNTESTNFCSVRVVKKLVDDDPKSYSEALEEQRLLESVIEVDSECAYFPYQKLFNDVLVRDVTGRVRERKRALSLVSFLGHLVLVFRSLFTIASIRFSYKDIEIAHYMIDATSSAAPIDERSRYIVDLLPLANTYNFYHISNLRESIYGMRNKKNPIYFESFFYCFEPLIIAEKIDIELNSKQLTDTEAERFQAYRSRYEFAINRSAKKVKLYKLLLKLLRLKKFIFLDDTRHINELVFVANKLAITSIGYMHARFNEFHIGLEHIKFGKYLVWSEYFKSTILKMNTSYEDSDVIVIGHPQHIFREKNIKSRNKVRIMILEESNASVLDSCEYLDQLKAIENVELFYKCKPRLQAGVPRPILEKYCIKVVTEGNIFDALIRCDIDILMGTHSTALIESWLVGVPSIIIDTKYDYGRHIMDDRLAFPCSSPKRIQDLVRKLSGMSENEISNTRNRIWSQSSYRADMVSKHVS